MIDLELMDRINGLMDGTIDSNGINEDIFLEGFKSAIQDETFLESYIGIMAVIDADNIAQIHAFCIGYALGQDKLKNEIIDFNKEVNKTKH